MSISDAQFANWITQDNRDRCVLVEMDYVAEDGGEPVTFTRYMSDKVYSDDVLGIPYIDCVNSVPQFSRSLTGDILGTYQASIGSLEIDNADGDQDDLLTLACDGSEVRFYYGDRSWPKSDFRLIFSALSAKVTAPSFHRISVQLKDASILLNKSVGGTSTVGGNGANADRSRPFNFGLVRQLECLVYDEPNLVYIHSDTGTNDQAIAVRDKGVDVVFSDGGDGSLTLAATPDGTVTADVLACPVDDFGSPQHRISDAMLEVVGNRAGLSSVGRYLGAHGSFGVGDADDYLCGFSVGDPRNVIDLLGDLSNSGNCFWAMTRLGQFTFGRLRPNDISGIGLVSQASIVEDDIDDGSLAIDHAAPGYSRFRAVMSKNWSVQTNLASSLSPDEQASFSRQGLYVEQEFSVGDTYADSPELYDLTMAVSPVLETWLTGELGDDTDDVNVPRLTAWMETRRFLQLPWLETISFTTGIDFYERELGDAVTLTLPRFGLDAGEVLQVIGIDIQLTKAKIVLRLLRRRAAFAPADDWIRVTSEDAPQTGVAVPTAPPAVPPVVTIGPIIPPFTIVPPIISVGGIRGTSPTDPGVDCGCTRVSHFVGQVQSYSDFNRSVAMNSTGDLAVVGVSTDVAHPSSFWPGRLDVYGRSGGSWSLITSLDNSSDPDTQALGYWVGISDDGTIVSIEEGSERIHVFTQTSPTTWSHSLLFDGSSFGGMPGVAINRNGDIIVAAGSETSPNRFRIFKKVSGTWSLQQTVNLASNYGPLGDIAVSADGDFIAIACYDTTPGVPFDTAFLVYTSSGGLTTWTLDTDYHPSADAPGVVARNFTWTQLAMSANKDLIAIVLPDDNDGSAVDGTVVVYKKDVGSPHYTYIATLRSEPLTAGFYTGIGSVAISDDGTKMFVGEPYGTLDRSFNESGRVFCVDNPGDASGGPIYMLSAYQRMTNPYYLSTNRQRFGEAIACNADGTRVLIASGDFDNAGADTVDFFDCAAATPPPATYFLDNFTGSGTLATHSADVGGAYSAEAGSLSNLALDGSGNIPSTMSGGTNYARSSISGTLGTTWSMSATFTPTAVASGDVQIDVAAQVSGTDFWAYEFDLEYDGTDWGLFCAVFNASFSTVFSTFVNVNANITVGVESTITLEVSLSGAVWKIDGTTIASTASLSLLTVDSIVFGNFKTASGLNINLSQVKLFG